MKLFSNGDLIKFAGIRTNGHGDHETNEKR